jgi:uncharacterized protein (TIGR03067 family)
MTPKHAFACVVILLLSIAPAVPGGDAKEDAKLMEGDWVATFAEISGIRLPDEILPIIKLTIKGDEYSVNFGGKIDKGKLTLDAAKKTKEIDVAGGDDGPNKGKKYLAIYEISADNLKICYDLTGKERPTDFKTESEKQHFLIVYKREKK